jgi:simple sugar transport system permease protein
VRARLDPARWLPQLIALVAALLFAAAVVSVLLYAGNINPGYAFRRMFEYGLGEESIGAILDKTTYYYLAGVAVAIGFRMGLFNIGVDGQYRLGALMGGVVGGAAVLDWLPGPLRILLIVLVGMLAGAAWSSLAGLLRVTRGVSEVISTIMLNFIAGGIIAYLVNENRLGVRPEGSNVVATPLIPRDSWLPSIPFSDEVHVFGFSVVAVIVGVAYWYLLGRTRFGFDLRATGMNPFAATASGVDAKRMIVVTMAISGAVAGLVGMPQLLGETHAYTQEFGGIGFTGIAIALLGRNHPVGIALGALLWSFLERSSIILDLEDIPRETVAIMQGATVLAVVVAYELASRVSRRAQQRRVGVATGEAVAVAPKVPAQLAAAPGVEVAAAVEVSHGPSSASKEDRA